MKSLHAFKPDPIGLLHQSSRAGGRGRTIITRPAPSSRPPRQLGQARQGYLPGRRREFSAWGSRMSSSLPGGIRAGFSVDVSFWAVGPRPRHVSAPWGVGRCFSSAARCRAPQQVLVEASPAMPQR